MAAIQEVGNFKAGKTEEGWEFFGLKLAIFRFRRERVKVEKVGSFPDKKGSERRGSSFGVLI